MLPVTMFNPHRKKRRSRGGGSLKTHGRRGRRSAVKVRRKIGHRVRGFGHSWVVKTSSRTGKFVNPFRRMQGMFASKPFIPIASNPGFLSKAKANLTSGGVWKGALVIAGGAFLNKWTSGMVLKHLPSLGTWGKLGVAVGTAIGQGLVAGMVKPNLAYQVAGGGILQAGLALAMPSIGASHVAASTTQAKIPPAKTFPSMAGLGNMGTNHRYNPGWGDAENEISLNSLSVG